MNARVSDSRIPKDIFFDASLNKNIEYAQRGVDVVLDPETLLCYALTDDDAIVFIMLG